MTRHSKNCTSSSVFTSAERSRLDYGVQEARVGKDSFRSFDACHVCLHTAKDPVLCGAEHGHLHCRQCLVDSMLSQMEANKLKLAEHARWMQEQSSRDSQDAQKAQAERVKEFVRQSTDRAEPAAKKTRTAGKAAHWLPGMTPSAGSKPTLPTNKIFCHAGAQHTVSLKKLLPVVFVPAVDEKDRCTCPVCLRIMKNGAELVALLPCGHVYCGGCALQFSESRCSVCTVPVEATARLSKEGTGFAAGGNAAVQKYGIGFSC